MSLMLKMPFFTTLMFLCVTIPPSLGGIGTRSLSAEYKHIRLMAERSKISDGECSVIVDKIPNYRSRSKLQAHPRLCVRLNDTQLLARLRQVGEFNPRFMAINEKDACRFRDLYRKDKLPVKTYPFRKGRQYQYPKGRLESCVNQSQSYRCRSAGGTPAGKSGLIRLCTECNAVTELKDGVFPEFINEVKCGSGHCLDHQGLCVQRSFEFTFIYFTKEYVWHQTISDDPPVHVYVEVWDPYTQKIGVCCECQKFS